MKGRASEPLANRFKLSSVNGYGAKRALVQGKRCVAVHLVSPARHQTDEHFARGFDGRQPFVRNAPPKSQLMIWSRQ